MHHIILINLLLLNGHIAIPFLRLPHYGCVKVVDSSKITKNLSSVLGRIRHVTAVTPSLLAIISRPENARVVVQMIECHGFRLMKRSAPWSYHHGTPADRSPCAEHNAVLDAFAFKLIQPLGLALSAFLFAVSSFFFFLASACFSSCFRCSCQCNLFEYGLITYFQAGLLFFGLGHGLEESL